MLGGYFTDLPDRLRVYLLICFVGILSVHIFSDVINQELRDESSRESLSEIERIASVEANSRFEKKRTGRKNRDERDGGDRKGARYSLACNKAKLIFCLAPRSSGVCGKTVYFKRINSPFDHRAGLPVRGAELMAGAVSGGKVEEGEGI